MKRNREEAFNHWWLFHAQPENRLTPSAIWDAACDYMKEEILWHFEKELEKTRNDDES